MDSIHRTLIGSNKVLSIAYVNTNCLSYSLKHTVYVPRDLRVLYAPHNNLLLTWESLMVVLILNLQVNLSAIQDSKI